MEKTDLFTAHTDGFPEHNPGHALQERRSGQGAWVGPVVQICRKEPTRVKASEGGTLTLAQGKHSVNLSFPSFSMKEVLRMTELHLRFGHRQKRGQIFMGFPPSTGALVRQRMQTYTEAIETGSWDHSKSNIRCL